MWTILLLAAGLVMLTAGAEALVRGASRLAAAAGLSNLVIGLTVVAFGTSAPELAVSVRASLAGQADLALGNVVGSNTFNVMFILGVSALIVPLTVHAQLVRLDVPIMIGVSGIAWLLALDGSISRTDGLLLLAGIVGYTSLLIVLGRRAAEVHCSSASAAGPPPRQARTLLIAVVQVLLGLCTLVLGAQWLVRAAIDTAQWLGISELVIGLTVVAAGTSLPEVATSIVAAVRGQRDIAIGNVVGSNIFNLLAVLGAAALVGSQGIAVSPQMLRFDLPVMTTVAAVCLPMFFTGGQVTRSEGAVLLAAYVSYVAYLVASAAA
jgi:cation:H+ antiporter